MNETDEEWGTESRGHTFIHFFPTPQVCVLGQAMVVLGTQRSQNTAPAPRKFLEIGNRNSSDPDGGPGLGQFCLPLLQGNLCLTRYSPGPLNNSEIGQRLENRESDEPTNLERAMDSAWEDPQRKGPAAGHLP